jgi:hypothetical protein
MTPSNFYLFKLDRNYKMMFHAKYLSSTVWVFLKEIIILSFFLLVAMVARVLHEIKFFKQY